MPFSKKADIRIMNYAGYEADLHVETAVSDYHWDPDRSMYLSTKWKVDHNLSSAMPRNIDYGSVDGTGRIVGAACYIMNPSNVPSAYGNWWGEGDEKIYIDGERIPSFFGTGSEDYYNYSWSSDNLFAFPYCGQSRVDGPATRGFVSDFRWHILDDIPFEESVAFYMELMTHGWVDGLSYGRMTWFYVRPGARDDCDEVSLDDVRELTCPVWIPMALLGSQGYAFCNAENVVERMENVEYDHDALWSEGRLPVWTSRKPKENLSFSICRSVETVATLHFTVAFMPHGGKYRVLFNGSPVKVKRDNHYAFSDTMDLEYEYGRYLRTFCTKEVSFRKGINTVTFENISEEGREARLGVDFFWIRY